MPAFLEKGLYSKDVTAEECDATKINRYALAKSHQPVQYTGSTELHGEII